MAAIQVSDAAFMFPVKSLLFAAAWINRSPGWRGWQISIDLVPDGQNTFRQQLSITPPGQTVPSIIITPHGAGVTVVRTPPADLSGAAIPIPEDFLSLEEVLLLICPLSGEHLAEACRKANVGPAPFSE
jgi:hypothetical protein